MFSFKASKKFLSISAKVDEYYKKFHSINSQLKEITEHTAAIPNERKIWIFNDFKVTYSRTDFIYL